MAWCKEFGWGLMPYHMIPIEHPEEIKNATTKKEAIRASKICLLCLMLLDKAEKNL